MQGLGLEGLNLPLYIIITLFFSYIIWSKFLNNSKFKIKKVDGLLEIGGLFFIIFPFLMGFSLVFLFIGGTLNMSLNLPKIIDASKWGVVIFVVSLLYYFITTYTNKIGKRENLKKILLYILFGYIMILSIVVGFLVVLGITPFKYLLSDIIILLMFVSFLLFLGCTIVDNVFKVKINREFKKSSKNIIISLLFFLFIMIICIFLTIPLIKYQNPINEGYYLYGHFPPYFEEAYSKIIVPIEIKTFHVTGANIRHIPIYYGNYNIETKGIASTNFRLLVNTSKETWKQIFIEGFDNIKNYNKGSYKKFSFTGLDLNEKRELIILRFDAEKIKNEKINKLFLEGYVKKNISEFNYSYSDNTQYRDVCDTKRCSIIINVTNKLDAPVYQQRGVILSFKNEDIINKSTCRFINFSSNYPFEGDIRMRKSNCRGNSCELEIYDTHKKETIFEMDLYIEDTVVKLSYIKAKEPIDVFAKFDIVC